MLEYQTQIFLIITCILFSGLFSGLEIAYISRDKLNFEIKSSPKSFFGRIFNILNKRSSEIIASLQIGINLSLVIYGIVMADFLEPFLISYLPGIINNDLTILIIQTIISTIIVLVTAE